jgi:hypothetical protein
MLTIAAPHLQRLLHQTQENGVHSSRTAAILHELRQVS